MSFNHSGTPQSSQADNDHFNPSPKEAQDLHSSPRIRGIGPADVTERTPLLQPSSPPSRLRDSPDDNICDTTLVDQVPTSKIFREELSILALSSVPVFGTQLFEYSFLLVSVISIGHISTLALAASTLGSMTASVTGYIIIQGFTSALDTLLPPAWTSDRPYMVGLWTQRMVLVMGIILIPIFVIWFKAEPILLALNQEPDVAQLATLYLRCATLGLPAYAFNCITRRYFQSQGLFDVPTRITVVVAPINAFLNWLFVYPLGLSFPGAPLATALSFNLVSAASIFYGYYYVPRTAWSPITLESFNFVNGELWKGWGQLGRLGFAGVGQIGSEWWSWELAGLAASQLGPIALAAQSVLLMSASTTFQAPFALSIAASVRIGNLLGLGSARRARVAAITSIAMSVVLGCIFSAIFLIFRDKLSYIFNGDPEVVSLVASIVPLVALFQVFDGTTAIINGIFRARGKQVASAVLNFTAYYIIGIPLGLYLTFGRERGLRGLWEGLTIALMYTSTVGLFIGLRGVNWETEAVRAKERIGGKSVNERDE